MNPIEQHLIPASAVHPFDVLAEKRFRPGCDLDLMAQRFPPDRNAVDILAWLKSR